MDRDPPSNFHDWVARTWEPAGTWLSKSFMKKPPPQGKPGVAVPVSTVEPAGTPVRIRVNDNYGCLDYHTRPEVSSKTSGGGV